MDVFELLMYMVHQEHKGLEKLYDRLDDEKLTTKLTDSLEEDTIGERLAHIIEAEYQMATYLHQTEVDNIEDFTVDGHSLVDIKKKTRVSMDRHLLTLKNLDKEDLNSVWTSKASGNSYDYKFLLWHFIEHIATHRGQVAMAINRYIE